MRIEEIYKTLRKIAKFPYYQNFYVHGKELGFRLFKNNREFTNIQMDFLSFLNMYSTLNMDIYLGDIDERVLENEIYEDSYLYYKRKKNEKIETSKPLPISPRDNVQNNAIQWVLKKPKNKVK